MANVKPRHWLDKAAPKFWQAKGYWRVRLMRKGESYEWVMKAGKDDPSSTGKALATAEWWALKAEIVRKEAAKADERNPFPEYTAEEEREHAILMNKHYDYQDSGLADKLSFQDYLAFQDFLAFRNSQPSLVLAAEPIAQLPTSTTQPFSFLLDVFRAYVQQRHDNTDKTGTLKSNEDMGRDRYNAYMLSLKYIESVVGSEAVTPFGEFKIAEAAYSKILSKFRATALKEREARQRRAEAENAKNPKGKQKPTTSGHWFNEHMKTLRLLTSYLADNRLVSATPPNIESLTGRFSMEATAKPMPPHVVRAFLEGAKDEVRAWILLAVNCGFRQAELATLKREHLKVVAGRLCVTKARGKTGIQYAIPLWPETIKAIEQHGHKEGLLFTNTVGRPLVVGSSDHVYQRFVTVRNRIKGKTPEAVNFNFEHFRDTGSSFIDSVNPSLTSLYLGQADGRMAALYVANVDGEVKIPQNLGDALDKFRVHLGLDK